MQTFLQILKACVPIVVALIGIIPTVIANRKKTEKSLKESRDETKKQVEKLQKTLDDHIKEDEDAKACFQSYQWSPLYFSTRDHPHRRHKRSRRFYRPQP